MKLPLNLLALLLVALTACCAGAEKWVITKEGGAYRVNGLSLWANGRLVDANGITVKILTKDEQREIGEAIDKYEPPVDPPEVQYYKHLKNQPAPQADPPQQAYRPPDPAPPPVATPPTAREDIARPADKESDSTWIWIIGIGIVAGGFLLVWSSSRCPHCGKGFAGRVLTRHATGDVHMEVRTDQHGRQRLVNVQSYSEQVFCTNCQRTYSRHGRNESNN